MAESILLACWSMAHPAAEACGTWRWVYLHRPDAVQFASILRSHATDLPDERRSEVSAVECRRQLECIFNGNGFDAPADGELFYQLDQMESWLETYLAAPHREPTRDYQVALIEERRPSLRKKP